MKKGVCILLASILGIFILSCNSSSKKNSKKSLLHVVSPINQIVMIAPQKTWDIGFKKFVLDTFMQSVKGMFYSEPEFSLLHFPTLKAAQSYKRYPNFIQLSKGASAIKFEQDVFASGQTVVHVWGENLRSIQKTLIDNRKNIFSQFHRNDKKQWRIEHAGKYHSGISELKKMGISFKIPTKFLKVNQEKDFVHYEYNASNRTRNRSADFTVVTKPYALDTISLENVIALRDLIGRKYIKGSEEESYMQTAPLLKEYLHTEIIKNTARQIVYKTTGLWSMKHLVAGGPFVNYVVIDKKNQRLFMFDGLVLVSTSGNTNARNVFYRRDLLTELSFIFDSYKLLKE